MKKIFKPFIIAIIISCSVLFVGCKNSKDDLEQIGQSLSNYYMNINYDDTNKSLYAEQTLEYVNNSNSL